MKTCPACSNHGGMNPECMDCRLHWLGKMDRETMAANAPLLQAVIGADEMNKTRQEWVVRNSTKGR